jgi:peptidoglycan/LPS O-acetylase OafA/YrhL
VDRTVVYEASAVKKTRPGRRANPQQRSDSDRYRDKLIKFVPAEAVAFFAVANQVIQDTWSDSWRWVVLILGTLIAVLYPTAVSREAPTVAWFFYVLAALSFVAWALGTSSYGGELFNWPEGANKIVLAAAVPIIPALDDLFVRIRAR